MKFFSTVRNRIFLASTLVAVLSIAFAGWYVNARVAGEAQADLERGLAEAAVLVEQHHAARLETLKLMAHLIADLPKLKAAVATNDPPTVEPLAEDYKARVRSDLFAVTGQDGNVLVALGPEAARPEPDAVRRALAGHEVITVRPQESGFLQLVTVPISIGTDTDTTDVLGTLSLGFALNDALAAHFKAVTASEIALALGGEIRASTLSQEGERVASGILRSPGPRIQSVLLGDDQHIALRRTLSGSSSENPVALVLRSRTQRLSFLRTLNTALGAAALVAIGVAVLLSYAVAQTVTRPLATITAVMRDMTATGDLAGKIKLTGSWRDEDAQILAATFNRLTDSIARFQQEASQRERLSALGRLSTVIAHEIRNPLMIIKASLRNLGRPDLGSGELGEAAADIDHEVARLNRIVSDVLDFARPLRMELAPADLNALCRDAATATTVGDPAVTLQMSLDPEAAAIVTDADRLHTALVNILSNARAAVVARASPSPAPQIHVRTHAQPASRVAIEVEDHGIGVEDADLPHIFEPHFSTKRTGSGLGLAIAKNIIDSLGGTIAARSRPGEGTQIRIELPVATMPQPAAASTTSPAP